MLDLPAKRRKKRFNPSSDGNPKVVFCVSNPAKYFAAVSILLLMEIPKWYLGNKNENGRGKHVSILLLMEIPKWFEKGHHAFMSESVSFNPSSDGNPKVVRSDP